MSKTYQNMIYLLIHSHAPDISVSGKQEGIVRGVTRSGLLYECERIIEYCKPKYLLLENVKNLVGKKFKSQFDEWLDYLESLGYTNYWKVLNAKDYGVPQNRERVFVVSILGDHKPYKFADKIPLDKCIADILEDKVDEKYYINKLFHLVNKGYQAELDTKGMDCIKSYIEYKGKKIELPCIGASRGRNPKNPSSRIPGEPTEQRLEINTKGISNTITTVQKDNYVIEPKIICEQRCDEGLRFFKDNVCGTIRAKDSGGDKRIIEPTYKIRKLTPRECFRLMGLKDDDIDKIQQAGISNAQQYKMAGNSIVVDVLEAIFRNLFLD